MSLFDVELYLTVHKSFGLNIILIIIIIIYYYFIIHRGCTFHQKYNELNHRECTQINRYKTQTKASNNDLYLVSRYLTLTDYVLMQGV